MTVRKTGFSDHDHRADLACMQKLLFGPQWTPDQLIAWEAVDDRIRGGSSTSHLTLPSDSSSAVGVRFYGHLDTSTLGGAGFASRAYRRPVPLPSSEYDGLRIRYRPNQPEKGRPNEFTIILKTILAGTRPDGRRESTTSYEYSFDSSSASSSSIHHLDMPFDEFKPFYRGRPQSDAPALDPAEIKELSIMCRSQFDKQSGDFELFVESIAATPKSGDLANEKQSLLGGEASTSWPNPVARLASLFRGLCGN